MKDRYNKSYHTWCEVIEGLYNLSILHIPSSIVILSSIAIFYFILVNQNVQDSTGNVKPECEHISQAYGDLGVDEYTPAAAASQVSLKLFVLIKISLLPQMG